ncbi:Sec14p-like phosphatidylinositol transfer family protein [Striga asiatica]|uniref:Sec14p-like phosphatidylinositol transfer family protein n=1 Tax=Striga asiatica TaxID=4170 RepID=A0A5A7PNR5_STRAF|nr:Sec14p-like phosphatidylinositol transfer family protein [Striga asiatica]
MEAGRMEDDGGRRARGCGLTGVKGKTKILKKQSDLFWGQSFGFELELEPEVVKYFVDPKTFEKVKFVYPKKEESVELMRSYFDTENLPTEFGDIGEDVTGNTPTPDATGIGSYPGDNGVELPLHSTRIRAFRHSPLLYTDSGVHLPDATGSSLNGGDDQRRRRLVGGRGRRPKVVVALRLTEVARSGFAWWQRGVRRGDKLGQGGRRGFPPNKKQMAQDDVKFAKLWGLDRHQPNGLAGPEVVPQPEPLVAPVG